MGAPTHSPFAWETPNTPNHYPSSPYGVMNVHSCVADAKGLSNPPEVEGLREKVYASLESYTKQKYPDQPGR